MLVTIAASLRVSLAEVAVAASIYYLLYGTMQPVWGILSDRLGRVRVMRLALIGVLVPGLVSAFAPNLMVLVVARAFAGGLFAAVIPAALVYIGDAVPIEGRQRALSDQLGTSAMATALATVGAGVAAYLDLWRLAFAAPVVAAATLGLFGLARLPEPEKEGSEAGALTRIGKFARQPWALLIVSFALIEGGVVLGFLTYLAPSLEAQGYAPAVAGLAVGLFGFATLVSTRITRALDNVGKHVLIFIGGALLAAGYATGATLQSFPGVALSAFLVGGGFAFMHPTLQNWATEVAPEARATVISFFAAALFVGSGISTTLAAPLAENGSFAFLFALAAVSAVPLGLLASLARRRYTES